MLFGTLTFSGSYATGGDALDLARFLPQMSTLRQVVPMAAKVPANLQFDIVNKKLLVFWINAAAATEAAGPVQHAAAAYESVFTATPVPVVFLVK